MSRFDKYPSDLESLRSYLEDSHTTFLEDLNTAIYAQEQLGWKVKARWQKHDLHEDDWDWWLYVITPKYPDGWGAVRCYADGDARNLMFAGWQIVGYLHEEFLEAVGLDKHYKIINAVVGGNITVRVVYDRPSRYVFNGGR